MRSSAPAPAPALPLIGLQLTALLALTACLEPPTPVLPPMAGPEPIADQGVQVNPSDAAGMDGQPTDAETPMGCRAEQCNGVDDDCDGRVDEAVPVDCAPCTVPPAPGERRQRGVCAEGRRVCSDGGWRCETIGGGAVSACNLLDDDCDDRVDELDEVSTPIHPAVSAQCGAPGRLWDPAGDDAPCEADDEVGCAAVHACLEPGCRTACQAVVLNQLSQCLLISCAEPGALDDCLEDCHRAATDSVRLCLLDCPPVDADAARWRCDAAPDGPACTIAGCAEGFALIDGRCVAVEICNNGIDDDGDGLVDGTATTPMGPSEDASRCMARLPTQGRTAQIGGCPPDTPGCDAFLAPPPWSCGENCPYAPTLEYDVALDREEVSVRAYAACVESGCCTPADSRAYEAGVRALARAPSRPAEIDGCAPPVDIDWRAPGPLLADVPVTGVTWCQARDYCLWAGKRLPTEAEWEWAATGFEAQRRRYPWGDTPVPLCSAAQCCRAPGDDRPAPAGCVEPLPPCPADRPAPDGVRSACFATLGVNEGCPVEPGCPGCALGPAPVWSGVDGATPEGVLNMIGNAAEWVFDWGDPSYAGRSPLNPVGPGCSTLPGPSRRAVRSGDFLETVGLPESMGRFPVMPSAALPGLGFRCARTVVDDGLCDPGDLDPPAGRCAPPTDLSCPGPDLTDSFDAACPSRLPGGDCLAGVAQTCTVPGAVLGCGAYVVDTMTLDSGAVRSLIDRVQPALDELGVEIEVPVIDARLNGFVTRLLQDDLGASGGQTFFVLDVAEGFGADDIWPATLFNARLTPDGFKRMGLGEDGICAPLQALQLDLSLTAGRVANLGVLRSGELYLRGARARIPFSAFLLFDAVHDARAGRLSGSLAFAMSLGDAARSTLGDDTADAIAELFDESGLPAMDLCVLQEMGAFFTQNPERVEPWIGRGDWQSLALMPGCVLGECPEAARHLCTGWMMPATFSAVDARMLPLGLDEEACGPAP